MTAWLKSLHYDPNDGWTVAPGEQTWISDAGRRKNGKRVYRADGQPWGQPRWEVGDLVALYFGGTYKIPLVVEVTAEPVFDPKRVQREGRLRLRRAGEGERWPWLTEVVGVLEKPLAQAPTLDDIGLDSTIVMRRTRAILAQRTMARIVRRLS